MTKVWKKWGGISSYEILKDEFPECHMQKDLKSYTPVSLLNVIDCGPQRSDIQAFIHSTCHLLC